MRTIIILAAACAATACGSGDQSNAPVAVNGTSGEASTAPVSKSDAAKMRAVLSDPCSLVSKEAMGKAMGATVDKTSPIPAKGPSDVDASCNYQLSDGRFVNTDITYREGYFTPDEINSRKGFLASGAPAQDVPGVGDVAFWSPNPKNFQLYVFRGGAEQVSFGPSKLANGGEKEAAIAMAKAAGY
jgi:hypothetical protein